MTKSKTEPPHIIGDGTPWAQSGNPYSDAIWLRLSKKKNTKIMIRSRFHRRSVSYLLYSTTKRVGVLWDRCRRSGLGVANQAWLHSRKTEHVLYAEGLRVPSANHGAWFKLLRCCFRQQARRDHRSGSRCSSITDHLLQAFAASSNNNMAKKRTHNSRAANEDQRAGRRLRTGALSKNRSASRLSCTMLFLRHRALGREQNDPRWDHEQPYTHLCTLHVTW